MKIEQWTESMQGIFHEKSPLNLAHISSTYRSTGSSMPIRGGLQWFVSIIGLITFCIGVECYFYSRISKISFILSLLVPSFLFHQDKLNQFFFVFSISVPTFKIRKIVLNSLTEFFIHKTAIFNGEKPILQLVQILFSRLIISFHHIRS